MILLLSPHNDDETLFCCYTIMRRRPLVIVCTDSRIQSERGDRISAQQRRNETVDAMKILRAQVEFLGIPDTKLDKEKLVDALVHYDPDKAYAPLPNSRNKQHNLVGQVAAELWPGRVVYYSTYTADSLEPRGDIEVIPTQKEVKLKNRALDCYKSQICINNHHFSAVRGKSEFLNAHMYGKVSAVLVSWMRREELCAIRDHLKTIPFIDEVIIWQNTPKDNKFLYGRYLGAKNAKNDIIYVQDDDCLIDNIPEIFTTFDGEHLSNGIMEDYGKMEEYGNQRGDEPYSTLVGWGAFFKKEWISVLDQYVERFGVDKLLLGEADRIFTVLLARKHNTIPAIVREFPSAHNALALYKHPNHAKFGKMAVHRAKQILREQGVKIELSKRYTVPSVKRMIRSMRKRVYLALAHVKFS